MQSVPELALRLRGVLTNEANSALSPSATSESTVVNTPGPRVKRPRGGGARGSEPILVETIDEERMGRMNDVARVKGFLSETGGKDACMAEFQWRLFDARFRYGSWKHAANCPDPKSCDKTCKGMYKNDGNPYTYPRFMGMLFGGEDQREGVFKARKDFFEPGASERAWNLLNRVAREKGPYQKGWNQMSGAQRESLVTKLTRNYMRGFDEFIKQVQKGSDTPLPQVQQTPEATSEPQTVASQFTHQGVIGNPNSPSNR